MFTLLPSAAKLLPNESTVIKIACTPLKEGFAEETVIFFISECEAAIRKGIFIPLKVTGTLPSLDFTETSHIFSEQYKIKSLEDIKCLQQVSFMGFIRFMFRK